MPGAPPADRVRGGHLEPRRAQGVRRDLRPDEPDRRDPRQGVTMVFYLWQQAFQLQQRGLRVGDRDRAAGRDARLLDRQRAAARAREEGEAMSQRARWATRSSGGRGSRRRAGAAAGAAARSMAARQRLVRRPVAPRRHHGLPVRLDAADLAQGTGGPVTSVPPQFLPNDPTLANYVKVLGQPADPEATSSTARSSPSRRGCSTSWSRRWPPTRWPRCGSSAARRSSTRCSPRSSCRPS